MARPKPRVKPAPQTQPTRDFRVTHSSSVPNWRTEPALFAALDREFYFGIDAAATHANALVASTEASYFGPDHTNPQLRDALAIPDWLPYAGGVGATVFCNPPSSREEGLALDVWLAKFVEQSMLGCTIAAVVPHKTSSSWWAHARLAQEIREIPYRVKFWLAEEELAVINAARAAEDPPRAPLKSGDSAGFDSAVLIFRPQPGVVGPAAPRVVTYDFRSC